jgi:hypothetical protein
MQRYLVVSDAGFFFDQGIDVAVLGQAEIVPRESPNDVNVDPERQNLECVKSVSAPCKHYALRFSRVASYSEQRNCCA